MHCRPTLSGTNGRDPRIRQDGDNIDGSWGGANTHIQENTTERTTAPIVMDCVQALHWLHAIQPGPSTPAGCGEEDLGDGWMPPTKDQAWTLPKADITKAHRRIKVLKPDWKYQWLNLVLKHGGSTRWAPTAWLQRNYNWGEWTRYFSE